jgi:ketosteroid isomerase-like protein
MLAFSSIAGAHGAARAASTQPSAAEVIKSYFAILNTGMKSGDFAAMASVYAPDATLTHSTPQGLTQIFRGLNAINNYYRATHTKYPGFQFEVVTERILSPTIVYEYDVAGRTQLRDPTKCAHLFVVQNGKIETDDWVTYFAGIR